MLQKPLDGLSFTQPRTSHSIPPVSVHQYLKRNEHVSGSDSHNRQGRRRERRRDGERGLEKKGEKGVRGPRGGNERTLKQLTVTLASLVQTGRSIVPALGPPFSLSLREKLLGYEDCIRAELRSVCKTRDAEHLGGTRAITDKVLFIDLYPHVKVKRTAG